MSPGAPNRNPPPPAADSILLIEVGSIAIGYVVADALVKAATVHLLTIAVVSPGKLFIVAAGEVAALESARAAGLSVAGPDLLGELLLPRLHPQVFEVIAAPGGPVGEALGILECSTVASGWLAADAAAKEAAIRLLEFRRGAGIGGKSVLLLTGTTADVAAALAAGCRAGAVAGDVRAEHVPGVHEDLKAAMAARFGAGAGGA